MKRIPDPSKPGRRRRPPISGGFQCFSPDNFTFCGADPTFGPDPTEDRRYLDSRVADAIIHDICRAVSDMPYARLRPGEAQSLGGYLFPNGVMLINRVGQALCDYPAAFPEFAGLGPQLIEHSRSAEGWLILRGQLLILAGRADDTYKAIQGRAIQLSLEILRHAQQAIPGLSRAQVLDRMLALSPATQIMTDYHAGLRQRKARRAQLRAEALEHARLHPGQKPQKPVRSAQRRRADQLRKARLNAQILDELWAAMRESKPPGAEPSTPSPPG